MGNYREVWEEANGPIPKGMHIHHILPQYLDGTDELDNLQLVTPEEHYDIHFERGEFGACSLLSDGIDREAPMRPVRQYNLNGNFIKEFVSLTSAGSNIRKQVGKNISTGTIGHCCLYNAKSAHGYQWFYAEEVGDLDFVGPIERVGNFGGNNTKRGKYRDKITGEIYTSMRKVIKSVFPNWTGMWKTGSKEWNDRIEKIK